MLNPDEGPCEICQSPSQRKCSGCKTVFYCSQEHQREHWPAHKESCRPYEIGHCKQLGRFLVARRNLQPGDVIFRDSPLVAGPKRVWDDSTPISCVGCCKLLGDVLGRCPECLWPACSSNCPGLKNPSSHSFECQVIKLRNAAGHPDGDTFRMDVLIILRALFLQKIDQKKWQTLLNLEDHLDKRGPGTEVFKEVQDKVNYIQEYFLKPLKSFEESSGQIILPQTSGDIIHKIIGALDVNALELTSEVDVELLYPVGSLVEHSCVPNCVLVIDEQDDYKITYRAALPIVKGDHIKVSYTDILKGTQERKRYLQETKYFTCACERCRDPTELGTFFSALVCLGTEKEPCNGIQLPDKPTEDGPRWICNKCGIKLPNEDVMKFVHHLGLEVDKRMEKKPKMEELEEFLGKILTFLHPNHYLVYTIKHSLVQLYKSDDGIEISNDFLKTKLLMCEELIGVTKKVDPGNARLGLYLGVLLYEQFQAKFKLLSRNIDHNDAASISKEASDIFELLDENKRVLSYERQTSSGSKLYELICRNQEQFKNWLKLNSIVF